MRAFVAFAILAVATPAHADSFVDLFGGMSLPIGDDDWNDAVDPSPKLGLRVGAVPRDIGAFLQADWTPVNTEADGLFGGALDVSAHRFRIGVGAMVQHAVNNKVRVAGRGALGVDIARTSAEAAGFEVDDTNVGLALELGGGVYFRSGNLELGGELGLPISIHDNEEGDGEIANEWTTYDLDLLLVVRFLSN